MGLLSWLKQVSENRRFGAVPEPSIGIQTFPHSRWRTQHVERYVEMARAAGYEAEVYDYVSDRANDAPSADAGLDLATQPAWWVTVWVPGTPKPLQADELAAHLRSRQRHGSD
jgi:hypothetical protein